MAQRGIKQAVGWGCALWLFGYILGILLYPVVPLTYLGWVISPIGILATLWVLWKKVPLGSWRQALMVGTLWTIIAIVCDYVFLVLLFKPADGYYKLDVYFYYASTFFLPLIVGRLQHRRR